MQPSGYRLPELPLPSVTTPFVIDILCPMILGLILSQSIIQDITVIWKSAETPNYWGDRDDNTISEGRE
jgi:hypothetical protein